MGFVLDICMGLIKVARGGLLCGGVGYFGVGYFGVGYFGVCYFGVGYFGVGYFGVGYFGGGQRFRDMRGGLLWGGLLLGYFHHILMWVTSVVFQYEPMATIGMWTVPIGWGHSLLHN